MPRTLRRPIYVIPLLVLALLLLLMSLPGRQNSFWNPLRPTVGAATFFIVNSTGDGQDSNLTDGVCNDGTGACTLRAAIQEANTIAGDDTITFDIALNFNIITLHGVLPDIAGNLNFSGNGPSLITVQRSTASGTPDFRIFTINSGTAVTITGLTISNGKVSGMTSPANLGGGILNSGTLTLNFCAVSGNSASSGVGGGIHNLNTLTVSNSIVSGNTGGGIANNLFGATTTATINTSVITGNTGGSGIYNNGLDGTATLTINDSTISNNTTPSVAGGGGILNGSGSFTSRASLTINNSTISGNTASDGRGGGIYSAAVFGNAQTTLTVTNSTISGNTASGDGGGILHFGDTGGIALATIASSTISANNAGTGNGGGIFIQTANINSILTVRNTIAAGNFGSSGTISSDITGTADPASSFNLIGTGGSGGLTDGVNNNQVGVANPGLGSLASNGGPTQTHPLLPGSPASDTGSNTLATDAGLTTDQRGAGFSRIVDGLDADTTPTVDIGAFEAQVSVEDLTDKTINEDTQLQVSFMVAGSVTGVSAASSNTTLVPSHPANIAVTGSGSTRTLTINPAPDQFGTATITVTLNGNNSQSITETFLLTVNSVNDAPSFTKGPDQTVNNNAGMQTISNWATNILAGPANESGQTLGFSVVDNTNPGLFAAAPAISSAGTLTYAPATNAGGMATITIVLSDSGGTANGGQDMSPAQSFNINVVPVGGFIRFESAAFNTTENSGFTAITVIREGDLSGAATVNYATSSDTGLPCSMATGNASPKCDFTSAAGTLRFAAGEGAKIITVLISQDSYVEGPETLTLALSDQTGGSALGAPSTAMLTITDDPTEPATNPVDVAESFVRQHYHDFLNREPDASGLAFWSNQITECLEPGATCNAEVRRINVSAAFFLSIEFQETGYLVYRFYKSAYGNLAGAPVPLRLDEFLPDTQQIGKDVIVGQTGWEQVLENNKQAFATDFVARSRFTNAYPTTLTPTEFVDALFANAGVTPPDIERQEAINEFGSAPDTADTVARGRALRRVAENSTLAQQEFNKAFVLMQYFGYLRRNPNDAPEPGLNFDGYNFWLGKLNQFNGNFVNAEMVKAFILSGEYRQRFGP